jgi:hypothetical protein
MSPPLDDEAIARWREQREWAERDATSPLQPIGRDDMVNVEFFARLRERARGVARITGTRVGTGVHLADGILLTAHAVIPDVAAATAARVVFGSDGGRPHRLAPERFFVTTDADDLSYTLVALAAPFDDVPVVKVAPQYNATLPLGEPLNLIAHIDSGAMRFGLRDFMVAKVTERAVFHTLDRHTLHPGAAVFDWQWRLLAIHRTASPPQRGERLAEALRLDAILDDLTLPPTTPEARALRTLAAFSRFDELHPSLDDVEPASRRRAPRIDVRGPPHIALAPETPHAVSITVPLQVTVSLRSPLRTTR